MTKHGRFERIDSTQRSESTTGLCSRQHRANQRNAASPSYKHQLKLHLFHRNRMFLQKQTGNTPRKSLPTAWCRLQQKENSDPETEPATITIQLSNIPPSL